MKKKKVLGVVLGVVLTIIGANVFASENDLTISNKYGKTIKVVRASSDHDFVVPPKDNVIEVNKKLVISVIPKNSYWVEIGTSEENLERVYVEYDNTKENYTVNLINQVGTICVKKIGSTDFSVEAVACSKEQK